MHFVTVYNQTTEKIDLFTGFLPLLYLFFFLGILLIVNYKLNLIRGQKIPSLFIGLFFMSVSIILSLFSLGGKLSARAIARHIMNTHSYYVVEGMPENYHIIPKEGHDWEWFDINGKHFAYSDRTFNGLSPGYNHAGSKVDVITPNHYYRLVYYLNWDSTNSILKIDIRR